MAENSNRNAACKPQFENPCPPNIKKACPAQNEKETEAENGACKPQFENPCQACPAQNEKETKTESEVELKKKPWSPPFDARFPNQNQTRNCWQNYVDYFRCQKIKGEDYAPCEYFKKVYSHLCPSFWVEEWDDQRALGIFPGRI